jgi:hypothetical protein
MSVRRYCWRQADVVAMGDVVAPIVEGTKSADGVRATKN